MIPKALVKKTKMFFENDADLKFIKNKKVAIIGCGSQGHAHALNLQDSGVDVVVGLREESKTGGRAKEAGLRVMETSQASKYADLIMMLVPDTATPEIYEKSILPNLKKGKTLAFAHGFNIHFKTIKPPKNIDVIMVAPKGPGHLVRALYKQGFGTPALLAVWQDSSKKAWQTAFSYAKALGATRAGVIKTTFKEETETDLFGEQVVLCGGLVQLIKNGFETLVEAGYQPEVAYYECLHETKLITDLIHIGGISAMNYSISDTAEWGEYCSGERIITHETKKEMKKILKEIQSGKFATNWVKECKDGLPNFMKKRSELINHPIEKIGDTLRTAMRLKDRLQGGGTKQFLAEENAKKDYKSKK